MPIPTFYARSLTELIDVRAANQPDQAAVHTGAAEFGDEIKTLTYSQIKRAVNRIASHYSHLQTTPAGTLPAEQVISVLISTAVDESLLEIALARLGLTALLLSVNNAPAAVAHLVKQTKSHTLIYGPKFEKTAKEVEAQLIGEGWEVQIVPEVRFPLWGKGGVDETRIPEVPARLTPEQENQRTAVILHSSGSTGFPKPVYIHNQGLIANLAASVPLPGFSALPLFHGFGHFSIFRCIYQAQPFTLIPPHLPLTSANICRIIRTSPTPPQQHFSVPYVLKLLAETQEGMDTLATFKSVIFAGAAVPDDLGTRLVENGVPLVSIYGTTETGAVLNSRRDCESDKGWNWLRCEGLVKDYAQWEAIGEKTFELVVMDGWPAKIMSNRPDGSYATKDLFLQHPTNLTWYKYIGRLDDTLTQTLGEKTNPVPIENAIRGNSPLIQECIVFGDGKPQVGCLILPSETARAASLDRQAYLDAIWPVIAEANSKAPTHSRILQEMVEILPIDTEIPVATKMSILRPACYKKFKAVIDEVYERFERGTGAPKREITDQAEMEEFLTETILVALGIKAESSGLKPDTDLFAFGVDSLQATRVRNVITKSVELGEKNLGQNIVYEYPSIRQLAAYLIAIIGGTDGVVSATAAHEKMWSMVEKWAGEVITAPSTATSAEIDETNQVVVLTGATGSLGAYILDELVSSPLVSKVICLSRAKSHDDSFSRIQDSLAQRMRSLSPEKLAKITSYAANVNRPDLGLTEAEYESIRTSVTSVIHNAWPVNFILSVDSFDEHIGGAVNLINLTLKSTRAEIRVPTFYFSSSVGTSQAVSTPTCPETFPTTPTSTAGMGYGRSKWVVEKVCEKAAEKGARVGVLRIGQLVGDTQNGVWNETEAWPLMIRTIDTVGSLPDLAEGLNWFPVDLAGRAIREIVTYPQHLTKPATVYHVLNNDSTSRWSVLLEGLRASGKVFKTVDSDEWLEGLAKTDPDVSVNPSYKLLSFYRNRINGNKGKTPVQFEKTETSKVSATIRDCPPVSKELVALWARNWQRTEFLK